MINAEPLPGIVYLKIEKVVAGALYTDDRPTVKEYAEVIAVGDGIKNLKAGDKVFVKAWALDMITHESENYYFCNPETKGILAKVHE